MRDVVIQQQYFSSTAAKLLAQGLYAILQLESPLDIQVKFLLSRVFMAVHSVCTHEIPIYCVFVVATTANENYSKDVSLTFGKRGAFGEGDSLLRRYFN